MSDGTEREAREDATGAPMPHPQGAWPAAGLRQDQRSCLTAGRRRSDVPQTATGPLARLTEPVLTLQFQMRY
jgi:hypothetical protein